ncbi:MAG: sulfatase [Planctomycetaceae bacterium]|nr:sulfatase [Planctomycetaceae bacterium]
MQSFLPQLSRRQLLHQSAAVPGMLGAATFLSQQSLAESANSLAPTGCHFAPRAKRVIHLFMNGGPFQADLFDPKPALHKYAGQKPEGADLATERPTGGLLPSPYKFRKCGESGVPVSDLLPNLANHIDDICVLRSLHADNPNHGPALLQMNNGTILPTRPSMGAWFLYGLGTENEDLPGYVVLCPGKPVRFSILWNSAFLPSSCQGTYINHSSVDPQKMIPHLRNKKWDQATQQRQLDLLRKLDAEAQQRNGEDEAFEARIRSMETAFRMQFRASDAFDLEQETKQTRESYGKGHFANGCLLARRLVERGVRFVQVYYGNGQPWDTHSNHDKSVPNLCRTIDQPIASLMSDLKQRGLLEDTLIIWGGEFGRTPTSENGNGRDHNHHGFTMWLAGGGVRGGMTWGETDEFGFKAAVNRMHVHDLHATVLHLLGLDHERLTYHQAGRDFRLTDVHGNVVREILA